MCVCVCVCVCVYIHTYIQKLTILLFTTQGRGELFNTRKIILEQKLPHTFKLLRAQHIRDFIPPPPPPPSTSAPALEVAAGSEDRGGEEEEECFVGMADSEVWVLFVRFFLFRAER